MHVDQRIEKGRVGLGLDRHPLRRAGAGDRQVRLDLHALHAAHARLGVAPHAHHAAGGLDVGAAGDQVVAQRRVGRDDEGAMPELAVQVLGVVALDALPRAEAHVHRPPRAEERREGAHVRLRRAAAAEARGHARVAGFVGDAALAHGLELGRDEVHRLVPRDRARTPDPRRAPSSGWCASSATARDSGCRSSAPGRRPSRRPCPRPDARPPRRNSARPRSPRRPAP